MKKLSVVALLMIAVLLVSTAPSFAWSRGGGGVHGGFHGHGRGVVFIGPGFGWGWGPYWGWGGYYPPPYYYPQPQVYVQPAPVYADSPAPPESYWYYCASTKAYYPSVPSCGEAWIKVPPRSE